MSAVLIIAVAGLVLGLIFFLPWLVLPQVYRQVLFVGRLPAWSLDYIAGKSQSLITTVFNQEEYE
nr:MAG TPA: hypothetical protein [Caudoviricetes sp.]DAP58574.1 MAG TPA: hypothetical protein [Caudoviricetes sp.]